MTLVWLNQFFPSSGVSQRVVCNLDMVEQILIQTLTDGSTQITLVFASASVQIKDPADIQFIKDFVAANARRPGPQSSTP